MLDDEDRDGETVGAEELTDNERFTLLRRRSGLTQAEVAEVAGVSRPYISLYEGGRGVVPQETANRLWEGLDRLRDREQELDDAVEQTA